MARPGGLRLLAGRDCVVALSGGADSAVAALGSTLHAASTRAVHVHHGLPASDRMADAARAVAEHLDIDLVVVGVEPAGDSETAAREARRPALLSALEEGEYLVTGHTRDDLAETVLGRVIRGTGPAGLAAMTPEDGRTLRPLLGRRREEIRARATEAGLPFVDDPENLDPRHLRTRIRQTLLPALAAENPDVVGALARLATHVEPIRSEIPMRLARSVARLPLPLLAVVGEARRVAAIREALAAVRPPHPPTSAEVERCLAVVDRSARRAELDGGLLVLVDRTWLRLGPPPAVPEPAPVGDGDFGWGGFRFEPRSAVGGLGTAAVPPDAMVRGALSGDRIAITDGHKDVGDALAEVGVPRELRPAWPVVVVDDEVRWVPLVRRAEGVASTRYLVLDARSEEAW